MHPVGKGAAVLRQRLIDIAGVSLRDILAADPRLRLTSPALRQALRSAPAPATEQEREAWVDQLAAGMARYMTKQFQYVDLRRGDGPLQHLNRCFVEDFADGWGVQPAVHAALRRHHDRLALWAAEQLDAVGALRLVRHSGFRPVCAYYTPELQLQVLGLRDGILMSPVLEVGCGDGRLVRHLRAMGCDATGIDRDAPSDMLRGDWFDAPLEAMSWGSIIGHQSVSLHFRNAHLQSGCQTASNVDPRSASNIDPLMP